MADYAILNIYGARSEDLLALLDYQPELARNLSPTTGAIKAELVFALRAEMATTITDALMRLTMAGLGPEAGLDAINNARETVCHHLGWSREKAQAQADDCRRYIGQVLQSPAKPAT